MAVDFEQARSQTTTASNLIRRGGAYERNQFHRHRIKWIMPSPTAPTTLPAIGLLISFQERHKETGDILLDATPSWIWVLPCVPLDTTRGSKNPLDLSRPQPDVRRYDRPTEW